MKTRTKAIARNPQTKTKVKEVTKSSPAKTIKVRLDEKTFIYLLNIASLKVWLERYPQAQVISP
jgi:hypothetical protein